MEREILSDSEKTASVPTLEEIRKTHAETQTQIFGAKKRRSIIAIETTEVAKKPFVPPIKEYSIFQCSSLLFVSIAIVVAVLVPIFIFKQFSSIQVPNPFKSFL